MLVLDASVTLAWGLPDEQSSYADAALNYVVRNGAHAPAVWLLEVLNGVLFAERAKRLLGDDGRDFLTQLRKLHDRRRIVINHLAPIQAFGALGVLAKEQGLTAYDAAYLHLAHSRRLPLASIDDRLNRAAGKLRVARWTEEPAR